MFLGGESADITQGDGGILELFRQFEELLRVYTDVKHTQAEHGHTTALTSLRPPGLLIHTHSAALPLTPQSTHLCHRGHNIRRDLNFKKEKKTVIIQIRIPLFTCVVSAEPQKNIISLMQSIHKTMGAHNLVTQYAT